MFENIGSKIKTVAEVVCFIGIIGSIITGIVLMALDEYTFFLGLVVAIGGSLTSWIGSFMTYGFGQLVENSDILVRQVHKTHSAAPSTPASVHQWRCFNCGNMISENICPICGKKSK